MKKKGSPRDGEYIVGRGRPPRGSRWRPGQSGNPKGRPKGGRIRRVTVREATAMNIARLALKGDPKLLPLILDLDREISAAREREIVKLRANMTPQEAMDAYLEVLHGASLETSRLK